MEALSSRVVWVTVGTINISGNFTNTTGSVEIELDTNAAIGVAGTDYDLVAVGSQANFGGAMTLLAIGAYTVSNNDSFTPVTYSTITGTFGVINTIGGETITPDYTAPDLDIVLNLLSGNNWVGAAAGNWNVGGNWSGGIPVIGDDVSIGAGFSVTIAAAADANTLSLATGSSITITAGTLTLANASTLAGDVTINGTTALLSAGGSLSIGGNLMLQEGVLTTAGRYYRNRVDHPGMRLRLTCWRKTSLSTAAASTSMPTADLPLEVLSITIL